MMARLVTIPGMAWLEAIADPIRLGIVRELSRRQDASLNELAHAVTAAFSLAILGATRFSDLRRHGRSTEAAVFGVLTALALAACAGAIVYGIVLIQAK